MLAELGFLARSHGILEFLHALSVARAASVGSTIDGDHERQRSLNVFKPVLDTAFHIGFAVLHLHGLGIGHLGQTEFFGHLWAHLCGIAVDCLASADDDVDLADVLDGSGDGIGCGKSVGTGQSTVCEHNACIGTAVDSLTDYLGSTGQTHGEHCDF